MCPDVMRKPAGSFKIPDQGQATHRPPAGTHPPATARPAAPPAPPPVQATPGNADCGAVAVPTTPGTSEVVHTLRVAELAKLPAYLAPALPVASAWRLVRDTRDVWVCLGLGERMLRARGAIVLTGPEWLALVMGAEADRAYRVIDKLLEYKAKSQHNDLFPVHTLGRDVQPRTPTRRYTVARVLTAWGISLREVHTPETWPSVAAQPTEAHP
jgi:hypothetical protein